MAPIPPMFDSEHKDLYQPVNFAGNSFKHISVYTFKVYLIV